jgi:hypothetical protein
MLLVLQTIVKQNVNEYIVFVEWYAPCSSDNRKTERLKNKEHIILQIRCTHLRSVLRLSEEQGAYHSTDTMYSFTFRFKIVWRTRSISFYKYDALIYVLFYENDMLLVLQTIVKQNVNECIVFVEWCAPCSSDNLRTERKWVHRICGRTRSITFYKYDVLIYVPF